MAGLKELSDGKLDEFRVDPNKLVIIPGWNVREESDPDVASHIRDLAEEMKANGIQYIPALTVYVENDQIIVTDGYCRTKGALLAISEGADIPYLPVRPEGRYADEVDRTLSMLKRNEGLPLKPLQKAEVVKRLLTKGLTVEEVAARTQKSVAHINDLIVLLSAPSEIRDMVKTGEVSGTQAVKTIRKHKGEATKTLTEAVKTAKEGGKKKATAKHIPDPEPEQKSLPVSGGYWATWGPKMKTALEEIRDADTPDELQAKVVAGGKLLAGMIG